MSELPASSISTKGRIDKKDDPMVKEGPCCFPFKDIGQGSKITEFNDWKEKIIDGKREPICATSVYTEEENSAKKDHLKTYLGFMKSIPAFLSKVTLDLKEMQTMG